MKQWLQKINDRKGQSLMELLIGIAVGAVLIIGTGSIIVSSIQSTGTTTNIQTESQLGQQLLSDARSFASGNWNSLLALATGSVNEYYLNTSSSPFIAQNASSSTSTYSVTVNGVIYPEYFYVSDMYRDSSGNATTSVTGNFYDPSTKEITVVISSTNSSSTPMTFSEYVTRNTSNVFTQTNWAGGKNAAASSFVSSTYANATHTATGTTGNIQLAH